MRSVVVIFSLTVFAVVPLFAQSSTDAKKPLVAVMVSDDHYDADKLLPKLMERLGEENGWDIAIVHGHGTPNFRNTEAIDNADVLVIFIRRLAPPKEQLNRVRKFVASGRGLVAIRTTSHGFYPGTRDIAEGHDAWTVFDREVLGSAYSGHGPNEGGSTIENVAALSNSPILKDVLPNTWHSESSLYFFVPVKDDVTIYQTGSIKDKEMPLTWTRLHDKTRVAYTSLGHQKDFEVPTFQILLRNMVNWAKEP